ncbi:MAG: LysE family translocator [Saccharospirillaceae bacterium]|nr:LysE family translocator [Pseudomonadales bacterium]NRB81861.1 LysE family translocator [Saccharospirillaceae bacterium]
MFEQLLIIITITLLCMVSPGPDMIIVMRNTLQNGKSAGLKTSLGVVAGNLVHISYCVLGIGWLISQSILLFSVLKYLGAIYLIYLGITSLFAKQTTILDEEKVADDKSTKNFRQGFLNNLLNPKGTMFYLGVFTVVITPSTPITDTIILISAMLSVSTIFWYLFVFALNSSVVKGYLNNSQVFVNRVFGVLLIGIGVKVATIDN